MHIEDLYSKCRDLLDNARDELNSKNHYQGLRHLTKLRELLNEQPELEAGGACVSNESSTGS